MVRAYRESMLDRIDSSVLESWYSRITIDDVKRIVGSEAEASSAGSPTWKRPPMNGRTKMSLRNSSGPRAALLASSMSRR